MTARGQKVKFALWVVAYVLAWVALFQFAREVWFLPAGLRLAALWITPRRHWVWLALGDFAAIAIINLLTLEVVDPWTMVALVFLPWPLYAAAVLLLRPGNPPGPPDSPLAMARLLGAGLIGAILVAPLISTFHAPVAYQSPGLASALGHLFGDFAGQLMLAPLIVLAALGTLERIRWKLLGRDAVLSLVPTAILAAVLLLSHEDDVVFGYLLSFAPLLFLAFRHGWVGAACGVAGMGVMLEFAFHLHPSAVIQTPLQIGLAATAVCALVLGAAITALRQSHALLAERNRALVDSNQALGAMTSEMRDMARRLSRLQEQGQRELAAELHDELGQAVTALATRLSLAQRRGREPEVEALLGSLRLQAQQIHESLRRVLRQLRPAVLDAYGLQRALSEGPLRDLLADAGVRLETSLIGDVDALDEDATTAIYRIAQEAVTNCVRHADARAFELRLWVGRGEARGNFKVLLVLSDDGVGIPTQGAGEGLGLGGIRTRVLALGGNYTFRTGPDGTRHEVEFGCGASTTR